MKKILIILSLIIITNSYSSEISLKQENKKDILPLHYNIPIEKEISKILDLNTYKLYKRYGSRSVKRYEFIKEKFNQINSKRSTKSEKIVRINKLINRFKKKETPKFYNFDFFKTVGEGRASDIDVAIIKKLLLTKLGFDERSLKVSSVNGNISLSLTIEKQLVILKSFDNKIEVFKLSK